MDATTILIAASLLVILSYAFDLVAGKIRIPSAISLFSLGFVAGIAAEYFHFNIPVLEKILPILGNLALILIVLEGAFELRYSAEKKKTILQASLVALSGLLVVIFVTGFFIDLVEPSGFRIAILNSIPLAVISSAIAIPTVMHWTSLHRDFIIYESALSDIIGIVIFNFVLANGAITLSSSVGLGVELISTIILSAIVGLALIYLMNRITHHIKFFLIVSILVLIFATGKMIHLSTLLVVFAFGIVLVNSERLDVLKKYFPRLKLELNSDFNLLKLLTSESAFILRTFFFFIFGFLMPTAGILQWKSILIGFGIVILLLGIRALLIRFIAPDKVAQVRFIAPRGLISILLYFSIPSELRHPVMNDTVLTTVIILTAFLMIPGFAERLPLIRSEQPEVKNLPEDPSAQKTGEPESTAPTAN